MSRKAYDFFQYLQRQLETDPEYQALEARQREAQAVFFAALEALTPEQRDAVIDFFGISQELGLRELELASFQDAEQIFEKYSLNENNSY